MRKFRAAIYASLLFVALIGIALLYIHFPELVTLVLGLGVCILTWWVFYLGFEDL